LMNHQFSQNLMSSMDGFVIKEEKETPEKTTLFTINCQKFSQFGDRNTETFDKMIVPYLIIKALDDKAVKQATLLVILDAFDTAYLPDSNYLAKVREMDPIQKVKKWIFIMANDSFVKFYTGSSQLFDKHPEKLMFPRKLSELTKVCGPPTKELQKDPLILATLTEAESKQPVVISGEQRFVELHSSTIQIVSKDYQMNDQVAEPKVRSVVIFPANAIKKYEILRSDLFGNAYIVYCHQLSYWDKNIDNEIPNIQKTLRNEQ